MSDMFQPLLDLRRRRMQQTGLPEITGNIQPPQVGPDIAAAPVVMPQMQMQAPAPATDPNFSLLAQMGAERGMNLLLKKLKPESDAEEGQKALGGLPVLSKLFRRQP